MTFEGLTEEAIKEQFESAEQAQPVQYAAIDLGSNSFHLAIAEYDGHSFRVIGRLKEKVQLANGLDENDILSQEAIERGLNCLKLFQERIKNIPAKFTKVVATYTLREAKNAKAFVEPAEMILNNPIEILPGKEEARLIYDGVSHYHPDIETALVVDIGGGSTEIILGDKFEPINLDSLSIGCVTYQRYFPNGEISDKNFKQAILAAAAEISRIEKRYLSSSWKHCLGSSGSIEAVYKVLVELGFDEGFIRPEHLLLIKDKLLEMGHIDRINFSSLSLSRQNTFAVGLAILIALFQELNIDKMYVANGSLREGILIELAEELKGNDNRHHTALSLMSRFNVDQEYAIQVKNAAQHIFDQVADIWEINNPIYKNYLDWACLLHEIGLSISFSKLRLHSAYIVQYGDMPGFSQQTKESLAAIIANQRKKLYPEQFESKYDPESALLAITQILRLAILLNIKRDHVDISELKFEAIGCNQLTIRIPQQWAYKHQLLLAELSKEKAYLEYHKISLGWTIE
ncbi:phosphatase [Kangiella profundi]|uniref:Phosphatase n=1 Tax=Kangiella profundi TaxID=1561924 RepID=A0A2K9A6V9_9GAMM|nr:phosphatase [Kangiella profundi]AUD78470.1 phosphatase [Kangiella profundi]GGF08188.1 exopolyphosphatase [Kangiella profundi]